MANADGTHSNWLVQGPEVASGAVGRRLDADPQVHEIRHIARDVLRVTMTPDRAARLKTEFGGLVVEPDAGLHLFVG